MADLRSSGTWRTLMSAARPLGRVLPHAIYSHLWFNGQFTAKVHGTKFHMLHTGAQIENEVFWRNHFVRERTAIDALLPHLARMDAFVDVGANSGFYSLLATEVSPSAKVIAVEPSSANVKVLSHNVQANGRRVEIVPAAVTAEDGEVTFYDFPTFSYSGSVEAGFRQGTVARTVQAVTLDTLAARFGILEKRTVVKIDVEGHEVSALRGATRLIASRPVLLIEILSGEAAEGVLQLVPPSQFRYMYANEERRCLEEVTSNNRMPSGNYLVIPL